MNWRAIRIIYGKEMRDSLRDYRTIISMIVIPVLGIPLLSLGICALSVKVVTKAQSEVPHVMIVGGENSPNVMLALHAATSFQIVPTTADFTNQIVQKQVRAVVRVPAGFDAAIHHGDKAQVDIYVYQTDFSSEFAAQKLAAFFKNLSDATVRDRLKSRNVPVEVLEPFAIQQQNVAPPGKMTGNLLGGILLYVIIILALTGAMYPAIDVTAGEKERGTMETVLCCPVARTNLVLGKFLTVFTISVATVVLGLLSMCVTFEWARRALEHSLSRQVVSSVAAINFTGLAAVFLMLLPVAAMLSAFMLMVGLFSKSFREAQSYAGPLMIVVIAPIVPAMLPGTELNARLALVPLMNVCLACEEMLTGIWHWNYILLIFGSTCVYAGIALAVTVWMFHREGVIFRS